MREGALGDGVVALRGAMARVSVCWDFDIVVPHWVGEELEAPMSVSVTKGERPKGGGDVYGDLVKGRADSDLKGGAPLSGVSCVLAEAA